MCSGSLALQVIAQLCGLEYVRPGADHVGHEPLVARGILAHDDGVLLHPGVLPQHRPRSHQARSGTPAA